MVAHPQWFATKFLEEDGVTLILIARRGGLAGQGNVAKADEIPGVSDQWRGESRLLAAAKSLLPNPNRSSRRFGI